MIFARKISKIPEFYMTFARKMLEFYLIIAQKYFPRILGGMCPLPYRLLRLWYRLRRSAIFKMLAV